MATAPLSRRRGLLALVSLLAASGCARGTGIQPDGSTPLGKPADSPEPTKIKRLLIWLPAPGASAAIVRGRPFDAVAFGRELKVQLEARGIEVLVATSSGFELSREEEQRKAMGRFVPTHRIELDIGIISTRMNALVSQTLVGRWVLYNGKEQTAVRVRAFAVQAGEPGSEKAPVLWAGDAIKRLEIEGFL